MKLHPQTVSRYDIDFTVDATPDYASGDLIDGKKTIENCVRSGLNSAEIVGAIVRNQVSHAVDMNLVVFGADPINTTFTDNAAFTVHDDDLNKILDVIALDRHLQFADNSVAMQAVNRQPSRFELINSGNQESTSLYLALLAGGAINFAAATDLSMSLHLKLD